MNHKIGTDMVLISRMKRLCENHSAFLQKCFTEEEIFYFQTKKMAPESIAASFACKEALSKAVGIGIFSFGFLNVGLGHEENGKPVLLFSERGREILEEHGFCYSDVSITHDGEYALAIVLLKKTEKSKSKLFQLPMRNKNSHKGNYGRVGIIGGSEGMAGAPYLASLGALRSGAGLVYTYSPKSIASVLQVKSLENILVQISTAEDFFCVDSIEELLEKSNFIDAAVIGPGLGKSVDLSNFMEEFISRWDRPLIIDADGLNAISNIEVLKHAKVTPVLTPHPLEFSRLTKRSVSEIESCRKDIASDFAVRTGTVVLLKGYETVVASSDGEIYVNTTGNPGMATAGMGDVLSGMIGTFLAQGFSAFEAAKMGAYFHGFAGDLAAQKRGEHGMIASDVLDSIPEAIR